MLDMKALCHALGRMLVAPYKTTKGLKCCALNSVIELLWKHSLDSVAGPDCGESECLGSTKTPKTSMM
jgi:hypothetical protein